jgi:predicted esterase
MHQRQRRPRRPRHNNNGPSQQQTQSNSQQQQRRPRHRLLVLHGNRQNGQLLLGRMEKLRKRLWADFSMDCIAPDGPLPHPDDPNVQTWWNREENECQGLAESLQLVQAIPKNDSPIVGILGFSQGARFAHLIALLHSKDSRTWFPHLQFVILVAGYDAPILIPSQFPIQDMHNILTTTPRPGLWSLHVYGMADKLILPEQSYDVSTQYDDDHSANGRCQSHVHDGGHFVPMKAPNVQAYIDFIQQALETTGNGNGIHNDTSRPLETPPMESAHRPPVTTNPITSVSLATKIITTTPISTQQQQQQQVPNEENAMMQQDEVQALEAMFPDEFELISARQTLQGGDDDNCNMEEDVYEHPITYYIQLLVPSSHDESAGTKTSTTATTNNNRPPPPRPFLKIKVTNPYNYPLEAIPLFDLVHDNNNVPPLRSSNALMNTLREIATTELELQMPSILACIYAAQEFLDAPQRLEQEQTEEKTDATTTTTVHESSSSSPVEMDNTHPSSTTDRSTGRSSLPLPSTPEAIQEANVQGLKIAEKILQTPPPSSPCAAASSNSTGKSGGGSFSAYTIGLV